jgi:hypothetical protein
MCLVGVNWINVAQNGPQFQDVSNMKKKIPFLKYQNGEGGARGGEHSFLGQL